MKRLGSIIQAANRETKPKTQATNTDDTQIPRPDLRFANREATAKQNKERGQSPNKTPTQEPPDLALTQGEVPPCRQNHAH